MSSQSPFRFPLRAALAAFMIIPPVAVFAAIPWLKDQPDDVGFLLTGLAATATVVSSMWLGVLRDRRLDEWHRRGAQFSGRWGWVAGASLVALLLAVPQVRDLVVAGVSALVHSPPDEELVVLSFTFGFMTVVATQLLCTMALSIGWFTWMSRGPREPS